jgi:hypothetical protein
VIQRSELEAVDSTNDLLLKGFVSGVIFDEEGFCFMVQVANGGDLYCI